MDTMIQSVIFSHQPASKSTHYHDCHEIIFVTEGAAHFSTGNRNYRIQQGDLIIFSRFEEHSVVSRTEDYRRYVLQIVPDIPADPTLGRVFSVLFNRPESFENVLHCGADDREIAHICMRLLEEKNGTAPFREDMLNLLTQQLLTLLCRHAPALSAVLCENSFETVQHIQRRLEQAWGESLTLEDLALEYGFSQSYLSHLFKRITGTSIMGYLQSCRIAAAKKQLAETTLSIGTVAELCGFGDASNFTRTFRTLTGMTPSAFRRQYRQK